MQMVAHDRIGVDRNCEALRHDLDAGLDPCLAVFKGSSGVVVDATEECPSNASLDAVVRAGGVGRCDVRAGPGHGSSVTNFGLE